MANRRTFNIKITESDAFLEMPLSTQCLYFHLNMYGDDDGFVNAPKKIMRIIGATDDDLKLLILKSFVIAFDSGVIVIKHWRMHNTLYNDRYHPTDYQEEFKMLDIKNNKSYTLNETETKCLQNDNNLITEHNITKHNITKHKEIESIEKNKQIKEINKRNKYGEYKHVLLTEEQHSRLLNDLGETKLNEYIKRVDEYVQMKGKSYKDYNLVIRNWFKNDHKEINDDYSNIVINYDTSKNPKLDLKRFEEIERKRKTKWTKKH